MLFFAEIFSNQEETDFYKKETLIVMDDPVSSFDFENRVGIMTFLRFQIKRFLFHNSSSRLLIFSHDQVTVRDLYKVLKGLDKQKKGVISYKVFELPYAKASVTNGKLPNYFTKNSRSEYEKLLNMILSYAKGGSDADSILIGNAMRRVLEAFSTFVYQKGIEDVLTDSSILGLLDTEAEKEYFENQMSRLVLNGESHYREQIDTMNDDTSLFGLISEKEKRSTAKNILIFMYSLNKQHIIAYLGEGAKKVGEWKRELEKRLEAKKAKADSEMRIIPLFDLPLSAGYGSVMFDGTLPHKDYLTRNPICDFALFISGSSMEPDIHNGSIVLIRRTEELAEGKIGAFFLDGNVYCKKFHRNSDGSVWLESLNPEFPNITVGGESRRDLYGEVVGIIPPDGE